MEALKAAPVATAISHSPASASEYGSTIASWMMPPVVVPALLGLAILAYYLLRT